MPKTKLTDKVQVELPAYLLVKLITSGLLHGDQCKCLNEKAKNTLWWSLLNSSCEG